MHSGADKERTEKKRKKPANKGARSRAIEEAFGGDSFKIIPIPTVSAEYNNEMNHVDRGDQLRSYTTYEHRFRRGPWQALLWGFLLDVALANSFILQLKTPCPNWKPYTTLKDWKECIYNAIFNSYAEESKARKRNCTGLEKDIEDEETHRIHIQRDINHVWRGKKSACLACKGLKQGQPRPSKKRGYLKPIKGNAKRTPQTKYGCKRFKVAICNNATCRYFYHTPN